MSNPPQGLTPPIQVKVKAETRDMTAANGDVSYTGYGFTPTGLIIIAVGYAGGPSSIGASNPAKASMSMAMITTTTINTNTNIVNMETSFATTGQVAFVKTYDADGFTLTWTKEGSPGAGTANLIVIAFK
jgi:hypothetical protein